MNKSNKTSRKRPSHFLEKVREHIWLVFPFGIMAIVGILAVVNYKPQILKRFEVNTQGNTLPPLEVGAILAGTTFPNLGQKHIPEGERVTYNSNPPTSGSHYQVPAAWGYLQKLQGYDSQTIKTFYNDHVARSPEFQNGLCPI